MSVIYKPKGRAREYSYLAINIYTGCLHGCTYCYAKQMAQRYGNNFNDVTIRKNLIENLKKEAPKYAGTNKRVLLCFMCDPYQPERKSIIENRESIEITREVIKILKANDIPFQVLTKGGMRAIRDFDLYGPNDAFATTMTFLRIDDSLKYEPNAASPADRIRAIMAAKEKGIETWISLEPVIDPRQSLTIIERTYEFCDLYKIGKLNHHKSNINWRKFAIEALLICKKYKKPYYIKDDLALYLKGIEFENTDTREVARGSSPVTCCSKKKKCKRCNNTGSVPSGTAVGSLVLNMPCPNCRKIDFIKWMKNLDLEINKERRRQIELMEQGLPIE